MGMNIMWNKIKSFGLITALLASPGIAAADWTGPYAGVALSYNDGNAQDVSFGPGEFNIDGSRLTAFSGYNWQSGSIVYGGEVSMSFGDISGSDDAFTVPLEVKDIVTLRGRVGYDAGRWLPYGFIGVASGRFEADHDGDGGRVSDDRLTGFLYGIGVDYMITDNAFLRAELQQTKFGADALEYNPGHSHNYADTDLTTLSVGMAIKF